MRVPVTRAQGVSRCGRARTPLVISRTSTPRASSASAMSDRWQRHGTASAHIRTMRSCSAMARTRSRLAAKSGERLRWRFAFAAIPVGQLLVLFGPIRTTVEYQAVSGGIQAAALVVALAGDLEDFRDRHWSHWIGASMRLLKCLAVAGLFAYWAMFPEVFSSR